MEMPATVRVEELGSETSSYRDAIDERRRVIHVRGSSPRIVWWTTVAFLAPLLVAGSVVALPLPPAHDSFVVLATLVLAVLLPVSAFALPTLSGQLAWRSAQWVRLELRARSLEVSTGPLGTRLRVDDWSVRDPALVRRESKWGRIFERWELFGEREDGWRVHLASLFDEASATWVRSVVSSLHEQTRLCILRWRGRIRVVLDPRHVDVSTSPWRSTPLSYDRAIAPERLSLRVSPEGGEHRGATDRRARDARDTARCAGGPRRGALPREDRRRLRRCAARAAGVAAPARLRVR